MSAIQPAIRSALQPAIRSAILSYGTTVWTPLPLFANSEVGVWYDTSDFSTMFQTSTGTTPVTAVGDPVGLILDKSKGLVLGSEKVTEPYSVTGSGWSATTNSISRAADSVVTGVVTSITSPVAGTAYRVSFTASGLSGQTCYMSMGAPASSALERRIATAGNYSFVIIATSTQSLRFIAYEGGNFAITISNISVKSLAGNHAYQATAASRPILGRMPVGGRRNLLLVTDTLSTQSVNVRNTPNTLSFTGTGTVTLSGASTAGPLVGTGVSDRVSLTFTPTAGTLTLTVSGSVTFAQLEIGSTATAYQKVTAAYDVTEAGVADCYGLYFDGVDDSLATAAIDFSGTDKVGVFSGLSRSSYVATEVMVELSTSTTANNAAFILYGTSANPDLFSLFGSKGTIRVNATSGAYGLRTPVVVTGLGDIAGDLSTIRLNGTATAQSGDQGTGNYGNYALYIGARAGPTFPFAGFMHSLTVLGRTATAAEIAAAESYVAGKTGVVLP